jgi:hypothetical protein
MYDRDNGNAGNGVTPEIGKEMRNENVMYCDALKLVFGQVIS